MTDIMVDTRSAPLDGRPEGQAVVVTVTGELDLATAPRLRELVTEVIAERHPAEVVVDLAGVTFLDSTGIAALVAGRKQATRADIQFRVRHPRGMVRKVLDVAGLAEIFGIDEADTETNGETTVTTNGETTAEAHDAARRRGPA